MKGLLSSLSIEGDSGVTLLTMPKGLTLNKLVKLAGSPKLGNATNFRYIWNRISEALGDIPVDKTYRIVITNNVLKESRNLSIIDQNKIACVSGCEIPSILEAATLLVVIYMSSEQRLYNNNPWTYIRCSDYIDRRYEVVVGGFAPNGLCIDSFYLGFTDGRYGVGCALRKF